MTPKEFAQLLKMTMRGIMTGMDWVVDVTEDGDRLVITAHVGDPQPVLKDLRSIIIWQFSDDGLTAKITLPNPPNFPELVAILMAGNLFSQALSDELFNRRDENGQ